MNAKGSMAEPNVLLIMADQMAAQALPVYGNSVVKAPNLSSFADEGVVFDNAYCNSPICAPSRFSMLTGRLPSSIDAFDNASEFSADNPTLAHHLVNYGYSTALSGKMHFVGPDQLHGFEQRFITDIYPADYSWTPDWRKGEREAPTGISVKVVQESGKCIRSLQIDHDEEVEFHAVQHLYDVARGIGKKPFFLTVSFSHPHSPYTAAEEFWDLYEDTDIDLPKVPAITDPEAMDTHSRWLYYSHGRDKFKITEQNIKDARHAYYANISYVDRKIGNILQTLHRTGLASNTIVIFLSDHGEMLGERGMWFKQTFFEWSSRIPLIIRVPEHSGIKRVSEVVSLVDLMPTLLHLCTGVETHTEAPLDGRSFVSLLQGNGHGWKNSAISEYNDMGVCSPCRMIRKDCYKLLYTHGHPHQLFDLSRDPNELQNMYGAGGYEILGNELLASLLDNWDPDAVNQRIRQKQRSRLIIKNASEKSGKFSNWSYVVRPGDEKRFVRGAGNKGAAGTKARYRFPLVSSKK